MEWIVRERLSNDSRYNAGSKARLDIDTILVRKGMTPLDVRIAPENLEEESKFQKIMRHLGASGRWKKALQAVKPGDTVYIQFPTVAFAPGLSKVLARIRKDNVRLVAIIHDLKSLREALDPSRGNKTADILQAEEEKSLACFSCIIAHNRYMSEWLSEHLGIDPDKMIDLEIFDYLYEGAEASGKAHERRGEVVIAGNLAREKAGYVYHLPEDVIFHLYGINYTEKEKEHIRYKGAFDPDELPGRLEGGFGLVWDGPDPGTCFGSFTGEYLQYNNPHKTSLYLAAGLPVIIWKKAAMADFILEHECGLVIESLGDIAEKIRLLTDEEYTKLWQNAGEISERLTKGCYTEQALEKTAKK